MDQTANCDCNKARALGTASDDLALASSALKVLAARLRGTDVPPSEVAAEALQAEALGFEALGALIERGHGCKAMPLDELTGLAREIVLDAGELDEWLGFGGAAGAIRKEFPLAEAATAHLLHLVDTRETTVRRWPYLVPFEPYASQYGNLRRAAAFILIALRELRRQEVALAGGNHV